MEIKRKLHKMGGPTSRSGVVIIPKDMYGHINTVLGDELILEDRVDDDGTRWLKISKA